MTKENSSAGRRIGVIVLSFNDPRIVHTIVSIKQRDTHNLTRIYIVDGGSKPEIVDLIGRHLRPHDVYRSERDRGIFDGLNKGLDLVTEDLMTWFGSDDIMSRNIDLDSIVREFDKAPLDCLLHDILFIDDFGACRRSVAVAPTLANYRRGMHIPHFGSYWRMSTIGNTRFDLRYPSASDQDFFLTLIEMRKLAFSIDNRVGTLARLGGASTGGVLRILKSNMEVYDIYKRHLGAVGGLIATISKLASKMFTKFPKPRYPVLDEFTSCILDQGGEATRPVLPPEARPEERVNHSVAQG